MAVSVAQNSRLRFSKLLTYEGIEFWDIGELPEFLPQGGDLFHSVVSNDRLDSLAFRYYGDSVLQWVIAAANGIDLMQDIKIGDTLRIPDPTYVQRVINRGTGA